MAHHIEDAQEEFLVEWSNPSYTNGGVTFPSTLRWARVYAETMAGALRIARYHYPRGSEFAILFSEPQYLTPKEQWVDNPRDLGDNTSIK